ncbi:MAG: YheC/YheD family protein [Bacillaceae bacterium]
MQTKLYMIKRARGETRTVFLPKSFHMYSDLQRVSFGTKILRCSVYFDEQTLKENEIAISEDLFRRLYLPYEAECHLTFVEDTIHIGPTIGVFTTGFSASLVEPFGMRTEMFQRFSELASEKGMFLYVFGSHQINWIDGTTTGLVYRQNHWEEYTFPLPNVIYDRIPNRKTEKHRIIQRVKTRLQSDYMIPWFNPHFFNKWDVFQLLRQQPQFSFFLPETYLFPTFDQLEYMLAKYSYLYLKPVHGSTGANIYQISYNKENNAYYCRYHTENGNHLSKFQTLYKLIDTFFKHQRLETYIAQQGVELIHYKNRNVDFRIHTNRDKYGEWQLSAIAAKIGGIESTTTHVQNGGTVTTLEEIFPIHEEQIAMKRHITNLAVRLSEYLDEKMEGIIGEIGFDFGVDKNKRIWLFEANSKPGRGIFANPTLKEYDERTRNLLLDFSVYLYERTIQNPEIMIK